METMYCNFFHFSEKPFDLTPDPKYLYLNEGYREILASLIYGIRERRGFIVVVGEVGTGKTTLINAALDRLDQHTQVAHLFNTDMTFDQLLVMALVELGAANPGETLTKPDSLHRLYDFATRELAKGDNMVLIVDEAQNLGRDTLESLRLLSNLETRKHKLIQIVLSGQPELEAKLDDPSLRQLAQRVSVRRRIVPLSEKEVYEYIDDRLVIANYKGPALFTDEALRLICAYSGGVPRKINMLCDNALLIAYGEGKKKIKADVIEEVIRDLGWSPDPQPISPSDEFVMNKASAPPRTWPKRYGYSMGAGLGLAGCAVIGLLLLPHGSLFSQKAKTFPIPRYQISAVMRDQPGAAEQSSHSPPPVAEEPVGVLPLARSLNAEKDKGALQASYSVAETHDNSKPAKTMGGKEPEEPAPVSVVTPAGSDQPPKGQARGESESAPSTEKKASPTETGTLAIQIGAFTQEQPAGRLMEQLRQMGYAPYLQTQTVENLGLVYQVRIKGYEGISEARTALAQLKEQGFKDVFIVRPNGR
jgi:type II secretory pathway predicted ATPase ExeA/cell division septation protein DedD